MKNIIKKALTIAILNSAVCGMAFAENPEEFSMVNFLNLSIDSTSEEMGELLSIHIKVGSIRYGVQEMSIIPVTEYISDCQDILSNVEPFTLRNEGEMKRIDVEENSRFCIKIIGDDQYLSSTEYYGPFIASKACADTYPAFVTQSIAYVFPQSESCVVAPQGTHIIKMDAKVAPEQPPYKPQIYAMDFQYQIRKKDDSIFCRNDRGALLYESVLVRAYENMDTATVFKNYFATDEGHFCLEMINEPNIGNGRVYTGPFESKDGCTLTYQHHPHGDDLGEVSDKIVHDNGVETETCSNKETMFLLKNMNTDSSLESPTTVEVLLAGNSTDCSVGSGRTSLGTFEFWQGEKQNVLISDITTRHKNGKFCVDVSGNGYNTGRFGPYRAKPGCEIQISIQNNTNMALDYGACHPD